MSVASVRAFVALPLDDAARRRVVEAADPLRERLAGLRWVASESLHVTLRFLGDSPPEALESLHAPLARAAARCPATRAPLAGLGVFPPRGAPKVLWLGVGLAPPVLELQAACERAAVQAGFPAETRGFRSHLTLGRWRGRARRPELPELDCGEAQLDRLVLFRSDLGPGGARHSPLLELPLEGRA